MPELESYLAFDKANEEQRRSSIAKLDHVKFTPIEGQVAFIKELSKNPKEAAKFMANPKQYVVDHGILLDPAIVEKVTKQVMFDIALDEDFAVTVGPHITKDIVDMRNRFKFGVPSLPSGPGTPAAWPVAAVAVAAVAAAAAAVVEAVVTLVRTSKPEDLVSLQGLATHGTLLPGGLKFKDRTKMRGIVNLPNISRGGGFL